MPNKEASGILANVFVVQVSGKKEYGSFSRYGDPSIHPKNTLSLVIGTTQNCTPNFRKAPYDCWALEPLGFAWYGSGIAEMHVQVAYGLESRVKGIA